MDFEQQYGYKLAGDTGGRIRSWFAVNTGEGEASTTKLVCVQTFEGATHVWQSSSGTDDFEPKLGLVPLILGTLKATLFSLLFGVPIALLGAIFTSEFLDARLKSRVRPTVELIRRPAASDAQRAAQGPHFAVRRRGTDDLALRRRSG